MNYSNYMSDLNHIYQSEVYGANVFRTAMRLSFNSERRKKWHHLHQLEVQTLSYFKQHLDKKSLNFSYPWVWAARGYLEGLVLGLLPWHFAMKTLADETQSFIDIWQRLKHYSSDEDQAFFNYVYAHEKAIEAFANLEAIDDERSTLALKSLLNTQNSSF